MKRLPVAVFLVLSIGQCFSGEFLVFFKKNVVSHADPTILECDDLEIYHGYSKLISNGKPPFEVKCGALVGVVQKRDYSKLAGYSDKYPGLKNQIASIQARWKGEIEAARQNQPPLETGEQTSEIRTLDGRTFRGTIRESSAYRLSVSMTDGVISVGIPELCSGDLKKWNAMDRSHDGRFWYERTLAIIKAQDAGVDVAAESKEAGMHFDESNSYLAEMDRQREERKKAALEKIAKAQREIETAPLSSQEEVDEALRMMKMGYVVVFDEATGKCHFAEPVDREELLRNIKREEFLSGQH